MPSLDVVRLQLLHDDTDSAGSRASGNLQVCPGSADEKWQMMAGWWLIGGFVVDVGGDVLNEIILIMFVCFASLVMVL